MEDSNITYEQLNDLSAEFDDAETELSESASLFPSSGPRATAVALA